MTSQVFVFKKKLPGFFIMSCCESNELGWRNSPFKILQNASILPLVCGRYGRVQRCFISSSWHMVSKGCSGHRLVWCSHHSLRQRRVLWLCFLTCLFPARFLSARLTAPKIREYTLRRDPSLHSGWLFWSLPVNRKTPPCRVRTAHQQQPGIY